MNKKKQHWEHVFKHKTPQQVSWTQFVPQTSMDLINDCRITKKDPIIDIGGGDSYLVDFLLEQGYQDLTVLDISEKALERAKKRLGAKAESVQWIVTDVLDFQPKRKYALWHDRASFHFLTLLEDILKYNQLVSDHVLKALVMGTFSSSGPLKCSGLPILQYTCKSLRENFKPEFDLLDCVEETHTTPFKTTQDFVFGRFQKIF
ncbi:MAG: class I SAM-dependent methyltransferase [Flavobacteriaceae bacterium]